MVSCILRVYLCSFQKRLHFLPDYLPALQQPLEGVGGIGGRGGWKFRDGQGNFIIKIPMIEPVRQTAVGVNMTDICLFQKPPEVIDLHVSDTAVAGTGNLAAGNHIPQGNIVAQQKLLPFRNGLRRLLPKEAGENLPEPILGMMVKEHGLPGLTEGKDPRIRIFESSLYTGSIR